MGRLRLLLIIAALFVLGFAAAFYITLTPPASTSGAALIGGPFVLTGPDGKRVTEQDFRGKLMLVFFGYTNCPDVCPTELQTMAQALEKLGPDANKVAPIFISVDPKRDTPEVLGAYVKSFSERIAGLTGTPEEVAAVAREYRVYYRKAEAAGGGADYAVDHSAFTYLMDGEGKYLTHFTFETSPDIMATVIKKHIPAEKSALRLGLSPTKG